MLAAAPAQPDPLGVELDRVRGALEQRNFSAAWTLLSRLRDDHPESGRVWEQLGIYHQTGGDGAAALAAFRKAVYFNDALPASWAALERLCRAQQLHAEAAGAAACAARLARLPRELMAASSLTNEGHLETAETAVRAYLLRQGPHVDGMRILAQIAIKLGVFDDAEMLLENIVMMAPDYDEARFEYAAVLARRRRYLRAVQQAQLLIKRQPANLRYLKMYAEACDGVGEYEEALRVYGHLSTRTPEDGELQLSMAHILKTRGEIGPAIKAFHAAAASPACFASVCLGLANTKTYRFTEAEIDRMRRAEQQQGLPTADRYQLCFALGKALEDRREYAESFRFYDRGNRLKRSEVIYQEENVERIMELQRQVCTAEFFAARRGVGDPSPDPIFIVGLPRAGSTLIEQILASHSQIDGTLELPDMPRLVQRFRTRDGDAEPRYPKILAELTAVEFAQLGREYLDETRIFRRGAPFFIDKMPSNFRNIGFIHLILPHAKIIDARREPMACCFGNFKQLFANGQEFNYSLEEIGRYYCNYVTLMEHWDRVLPGKVLRVQHEHLLDDLEHTVRTMLEFCGVPFESSCLEFYKTKRSVRTVSSEQVRRPIYREGMDQWRNYEPWLGPLEAALEPLKTRG